MVIICIGIYKTGVAGNIADTAAKAALNAVVIYIIECAAKTAARIIPDDIIADIRRSSAGFVDTETGIIGYGIIPELAGKTISSRYVYAMTVIIMNYAVFYHSRDIRIYVSRDIYAAVAIVIYTASFNSKVR